MLILQIYESELEAVGEAAGRMFLTPNERALALLKLSLHTVNRAGLDGKEIVETTIIYQNDQERGDRIIQIHGKVKHRLKQPATP